MWFALLYDLGGNASAKRAIFLWDWHPCHIPHESNSCQLKCLHVFFDWFSNTVLKFDPGAIILPVQLQSCWHNDSGILPVRCPACNIALQRRSGPCRSHGGPCAKVTEKVLNTAAGDIKPGFLTADRLGEAWDSQKCQDDSPPERKGENLGPSILTDQFGIHQGPEIPLWHNTNSKGPTWQDISGGYCCVCVCVLCSFTLFPPTLLLSLVPSPLWKSPKSPTKLLWCITGNRSCCMANRGIKWQNNSNDIVFKTLLN